MSPGPSFSIVTPSLNQGEFLPTAIESVLEQSIDGLDYLVVDGGSTDRTLPILSSYGNRIRWISEPDRGQSHAINRGFRKTQGEILAWINADDQLAPGALAKVRELFDRHPEVDLIYGAGLILDEAGQKTGPFAGIEPFSLWRLTHFLDFVLQPAAFFRRAAFEALGGLDETLHYTMDWDLWIRLAGGGRAGEGRAGEGRAGEGRVLFVDEVLGHSREYGRTKTSTGGLRRVREISRLVKLHTGRSWTPGVKMYLLDTLQRGSLRKLPLALRSRLDSLLGRAMEKTVLGLGVYADGWLGPRSALTVPGHWAGFEAEVEIPPSTPEGRVEIRLRMPSGETRTEVAASGKRHLIRCPLPSPNESSLTTLQVSVSAALRSDADPRELAMRLLRLDPLPAVARDFEQNPVKNTAPRSPSR